MIATKAPTYTDGVQLIDDMHQNFEVKEDEEKLKNSFTVFSIRRDIVERMKEEHWYNKFNSLGKIDMVSICIMEKECNQSRHCVEQLRT